MYLISYLDEVLAFPEILEMCARFRKLLVSLLVRCGTCRRARISGRPAAPLTLSPSLVLEQAAAVLDLRRGVLLELEKNDVHKNDAMEVLEFLGRFGGEPWLSPGGRRRIGAAVG